LRSSIFRHLDGIVTAPVVAALHKKGIVAALEKHQRIELKDLLKEFPANEGYLNVALRVLASQGFINYELDNAQDTVAVHANAKTQYLLSAAHLYENVIPYLKESVGFEFQNLEPAAFNNLIALFDDFKKSFELQ